MGPILHFIQKIHEFSLTELTLHLSALSKSMKKEIYNQNRSKLYDLTEDESRKSIIKYYQRKY